MLAIHASAVRVGDGGLIFLGPSGTGKSAICRLLEGKAAKLANDVIYVAQREDGGWYVADGGRRAYERPLSAEEAAMVLWVPLRAIVRLFQGSPPYLKRIDQLEACRYLTDALFEMAWQRDYGVGTKKELFADLAYVCRLTPGYEFRFDLSQDTIEILAEEFAF
jgi:hypothetical protein